MRTNEVTEAIILGAVGVILGLFALSFCHPRVNSYNIGTSWSL